MNDKDWTVTEISPNPPREWQGPAGTVYYIDCKLDGWDKAISIGKKSPDALKPGMTIYGHPEIDPGRPVDKFKSGQKAFGGQSSFGGGGFSKPAGGYQKREYHDNSDGQRQGMCFNNAANYVNLLTTIAKKPMTEDEWAADVHKYAHALYKLGDLGGSESTDPKAAAPAGATGQSKPWQANSKTDKLWPSDRAEDAEEGDIASLLQSGLAADGLEPPEGW